MPKSPLICILALALGPGISQFALLVPALPALAEQVLHQPVASGQAFSTFRYTEASREMCDLEGPNAGGRFFNGRLRSSLHIDQDNHWIATVAIEDPESDVFNGHDQAELPDRLTRTGYNRDLIPVMIAFVGRRLNATDPTGSGTERVFTLGFNVSGKLGIPDSRGSFKFQWYYGSGIERYINDLDAVGGQEKRPGAYFLALFQLFRPSELSSRKRSNPLRTMASMCNRPWRRNPRHFMNHGQGLGLREV